MARGEGHSSNAFGVTPRGGRLLFPHCGARCDQAEAMNRDFQYDVFLSHNAKDKPLVRRLATPLQA
jgi:hypothetical protein